VSVELTILLEPGEDGFWIATIPEIPGAFSQGKTKGQARKNVVNAMIELMETRRSLALSNSAPRGI
jgi:predicted RNase H-like HicB family nuclease